MPEKREKGIYNWLVLIAFYSCLFLLMNSNTIQTSIRTEQLMIGFWSDTAWVNYWYSLVLTTAFIGPLWLFKASIFNSALTGIYKALSSVTAVGLIVYCWFMPELLATWAWLTFASLWIAALLIALVSEQKLSDNLLTSINWFLTLVPSAMFFGRFLSGWFIEQAWFEPQLCLQLGSLAALVLLVTTCLIYGVRAKKTSIHKVLVQTT